MTKLQKFIAVLFLTLGMILPITLVSAEDTSWEDVRSSAEVCLNDYYGVVFNIRNEEMRRAYFSDMFTMSWCQINDALPLYDEYEAIKDQFRADAANCGTVETYDQNIKEYEEEMVRNLLEVYFIRNVKVQARTSADVGTIEERKTEVLNSLFNTMRDEFVQGEEMLSEDELETMFLTWSSKYSDTILGYSSCNEGPIWELFESTADFMITMQSLDIKIDKPERSSFKDVITPDIDANAELDDMAKLAEAGKNITSIGQGVINSVSYFYGHIAYRWQHRGRKGEAVLFDASSGISTDDSSSTSPAAPSNFSDFIDALNNSETDDDIFAASTDRLAEYKLLYGEIGAVSTTNTVILLNQLNQVIINNNVQDFPIIRSELDEIYGKQCSG
jgi:hypothetical protein